MRASRYYLLLVFALLGIKVESALSEVNLDQLDRRDSNSATAVESPADNGDEIVQESIQPQVFIEIEGNIGSVDSIDVTEASEADEADEIVPEPIPINLLHAILLEAQDTAENFLKNATPNQIPQTLQFASLASSYFHTNNLKFFNLFLENFEFDHLESALPLWELLIICRYDKDFFKAILRTQFHCILKNFRSFWYEMLYIGQVQTESELRSQCKGLHQSFYWAFEFFSRLADEKRRPFTVLASLCILNLIMDDEENPYPKSLVKAILNLDGIELNVSVNGACIALHTMGLPRLPEYYPKLILSHPKLDVNYIVPATHRGNGHITCHVPAMPLIMHALIYLNLHAFMILLYRPELKLKPLIMPFFQLLRLAFLYFYFYFMDPKDSEPREIV